MRPVGYLLLASAAVAMAAAAPQAGGGGSPPIKFICSRDECSCQSQNGLEMVTCDCSKAGDGEPLMLGKRSEAYLSDRTSSLHVRNCNKVSLVSEALSNSISLKDVELSDIASLELQRNSLYTDTGPMRNVVIQRVADLQMDPRALSQVTQLKKLEIIDVNAGALPLDSFADGADVVYLRLADSTMEDLSIKIDKSDNVIVSKNKLDSLSADISDVFSVDVHDNVIKQVDMLHINVRRNSHSPDTNNVTLWRNTISSMDSDDVQMKLDTFELVNNTLGSLNAPLRIDFTRADITGNDIGRLGPSVFDEFVKLDALSLRGPGQSSAPVFAFTFADNTLRAASNGSYGRFLTPANEDDGLAALFRVYGNRFACRCNELKELVSVGEAEYLTAKKDDAEKDDDPLFSLENVYGELYSTSKCVEGDKPLTQYRLIAYSADFECQAVETLNNNGDTSSATAAGGLTLLLAAAAAFALTV